MSVKKGLIILMAVILIFTMAACGNQSSGSNSGEITLNFWEFGSTGYDKLAAAYMEQNPHVKIRFQTADFADHHNNLFTAISAGSGAPDIALVELGYIEQYKEVPDKFYNLYDFNAQNVKQHYLDWKWADAESADGSYLIGLPTDIGPTVMFYRTDVFEAAGLPTDPVEVSELFKTWDDFKRNAKIVTEKTGKPMLDNWESAFNALRDQAPEQYFDTNDQLIMEDSPYIRAAYDFTVGLVNDGVVGRFGAWSPEWGAAMNDGSFAALLSASWMIGVIKGNAPDSAGKWALTTMPEGAGNWGGSYLLIPKQSKHAEEAYKFMEWLVSAENQLQSFEDMGLFPSAPAVYDEPAFRNYQDDYFGGINTASIIADAAQQVKSVYLGKNHSLANSEMITALENVVEEKRNPDTEWADAIQRIKRQISRQ